MRGNVALALAAMIAVAVATWAVAEVVPVIGRSGFIDFIVLAYG